MSENNLNLIQEQFSIYKENIEKFYEKANASAGTRARKALLEIAKLTKIIRKEIQDKKNSSD